MTDTFPVVIAPSSWSSKDALGKTGGATDRLAFQETTKVRISLSDQTAGQEYQEENHLFIKHFYVGIEKNSK